MRPGVSWLKPVQSSREGNMPRPRSIEEVPLPNWPALMETAMAARYFSMDENSFVFVVQRGGILPVDLGLAMTRYRRTELDRLLASLPTTTADSTVDPFPPALERTEAVVRRLYAELEAGRGASQTPSRSGNQEALSIADATRFLGIGRSTIYRLISEGRLEPVRFGRRTLLRRSDLEALLQRPESASGLHSATQRRRGRRPASA
jgi:excisionase family DNA binding protein